jgi:type III restriction enzyme
MLVVAQDTDHANALQQSLEADDFFEGRYKDRAITVHSKNTKGSEGDDIVSQLLSVEDTANPVEIVIHVNMLKEGWDVTNLYTIVPLRAANSRTLVEQSIGRGLRLPYGRRTGVPAVDRLTIVSHDKFQEIVDHAKDPNSIIRTGVVIGRDIPDKGQKAVVVPSAFETGIGAVDTAAPLADLPAPAARGDIPCITGTTAVFTTPEEKAIAQATHTVFRQYERLSSSKELEKPAIQKEIVRKVKAMLPPQQARLLPEAVDVAAVVQKTTNLFRALSIDVPRIAVVPAGEVRCYYENFQLELANIRLQPVSQAILIQHLHEQRQRYALRTDAAPVEEQRPEDYIVRGLIDFDDIDYDRHAATLYALAGQVVAHLRGYLASEEDVVNVLQYHQKELVGLVHAQMQAHFVHVATSYEAHVTQGFKTLQAGSYALAEGEKLRDFRLPLAEGEKTRIRTMLFSGFAKCLFPAQRFESDTERRFAVILENDETVQKWFKPSKGDFAISWSHTAQYEPDFVVETADCKYLCEPKRADQMETEEVQAKARAAVTWCLHASEHATNTDGKLWKYLLIPHDRITEQMTVKGLEASCWVQQ